MFIYNYSIMAHTSVCRVLSSHSPCRGESGRHWRLQRPHRKSRPLCWGPGGGGPASAGPESHSPGPPTVWETQGAYVRWVRFQRLQVYSSNKTVQRRSWIQFPKSDFNFQECPECTVPLRFNIKLWFQFPWQPLQYDSYYWACVLRRQGSSLPVVCWYYN